MILFLVLAAKDERPRGGLSIAAVLAQDVALLLTAVVMAALIARPSAADLGLRSVPIRPAVWWTRHGKAYRAYAQRTGRFAPLLGRLRVPR